MLCILKGGFTVFFVSLERSARSNTLTLTEFVAGYAQILLSKDISPLKWKEREEDLVFFLSLDKMKREREEYQRLLKQAFDKLERLTKESLTRTFVSKLLDDQDVL